MCVCVFPVFIYTEHNGQGIILSRVCTWLFIYNALYVAFGWSRAREESRLGSSVREYLVSGALQEMKNENAVGGRRDVCMKSTCHRRRLPFLTGN